MDPRAAEAVVEDLAAGRRRVHVVGIGGAGMSAIAEVLVAMGHGVTGSDCRASATTRRLEAMGIGVRVGKWPEAAAAADFVAHSTAVGPQDPDLLAALAKGVRVISRARILAAVCGQRAVVAVAGAHGKTTTAALLGSALVAAELDPSWIIGAAIAPRSSGARWGAGTLMVVEADESDATMLDLSPAAVLLTSVEADHLETYGSYDHLKEAYAEVAERSSGPVVVCADFPDAVGVGVGRSNRATYGFSPAADFVITDVDPERWGSAFSLMEGGVVRVRGRIGIPGMHNVANAAGALVMATRLGATWDAAAAGLATAATPARRFVRRGSVDGAGLVDVVDDYAHLPTEVSAAVATATAGWPRVLCAFQPHRFSRTQALGADFGPCFTGVSDLWVTGIYSADERPRPGVDARMVFDAVRRADPAIGARYCPDLARVADEMAAAARPGDLCLILGAGDVTAVSDRLVNSPGPARG
ncbi:MAG: UDP-N-acetylmuramate--L-alanine ligase [Acidimicrobiales bacterium]